MPEGITQKTEITSQRTRCAKTFDLGDGRRAVEVSIGATHYRQDGQWQEIDTAIQPDGTVERAPYSLNIDFARKSLRCRIKEDGSEFAIGLNRIGDGVQLGNVEPVIEGNRVIWPDICPDTDLVIEAGRSRVRLRRVLKSDKAPTRCQFNISLPAESAYALWLRAADANGEAIGV